MNLLPCSAKLFQVPSDSLLHLPDLSSRKSIILTQLRWSARTVQVEDGFTVRPNHMDMSRPMVVRVDHHAQSSKPQNCRHFQILTQFLSAWVIAMCLL